jgi:hypothetical protein
MQPPGSAQIANNSQILRLPMLTNILFLAKILSGGEINSFEQFPQVRFCYNPCHVPPHRASRNLIRLKIQVPSIQGSELRLDESRAAENHRLFARGESSSASSNRHAVTPVQSRPAASLGGSGQSLWDAPVIRACHHRNTGDIAAMASKAHRGEVDASAKPAVGRPTGDAHGDGKPGLGLSAATGSAIES